jgi:hypothetical protein
MGGWLSRAGVGESHLRGASRSPQPTQRLLVGLGLLRIGAHRNRGGCLAVGPFRRPGRFLTEFYPRLYLGGIRALHSTPSMSASLPIPFFLCRHATREVFPPCGTLIWALSLLMILPWRNFGFAPTSASIPTDIAICKPTGFVTFV